MDLTQVFAAGGIVGLFGATGIVLMQLLRQNASLERFQRGEIEALKTDALRCNRRVDLLVAACRQGGIDIPKEVWDAVA